MWPENASPKRNEKQRAECNSFCFAYFAHIRRIVRALTHTGVSCVLKHKHTHIHKHQIQTAYTLQTNMCTCKRIHEQKNKHIHMQISHRIYEHIIHSKTQKHMRTSTHIYTNKSKLTQTFIQTHARTRRQLQKLTQKHVQFVRWPRCHGSGKGTRLDLGRTWVHDPRK